MPATACGSCQPSGELAQPAPGRSSLSHCHLCLGDRRHAPCHRASGGGTALQGHSSLCTPDRGHGERWLQPRGAPPPRGPEGWAGLEMARGEAGCAGSPSGASSSLLTGPPGHLHTCNLLLNPRSRDGGWILSSTFQKTHLRLGGFCPGSHSKRLSARLEAQPPDPDPHPP